MQEALSLTLLTVAVVPVAVGWSRRFLGASVVAMSVPLAVVGTAAWVDGDWVLDSSAAQVVGLALCLALAIGGGGPLTMQVFRLVDGPDSGPSSIRGAGAVLRGGAWIGALERAAIFATLLAGWPEGVAVVLAVKGLGRYPELRSEQNTGVAERFIIGTFASVLWAVACTGVTLLLL